MSMVPVTIVGLQLNPSDASVVVLAESSDAARVLPILIGPAEARAIAVAVAGIELPRPGTHDLMLAVLEDVSCWLEEIVVTDLVDGTFHAELSVESPGGRRHVSARPSDAIALAVRAEVPIHVESDVLEAAAVSIEHEAGEPLSDEEIDSVVDEFHQLLEDVGPEHFADPPTDVD